MSLGQITEHAAEERYRYSQIKQIRTRDGPRWVAKVGNWFGDNYLAGDDLGTFSTRAAAEAAVARAFSVAPAASQ